jgi:hypothetical protein
MLRMELEEYSDILEQLLENAMCQGVKIVWACKNALIA